MPEATARPYGLIASFATTPAVFKAAEKIRDAGFTHWDVFAPFPIHGLDAAMGLKRSKVPVITLLGGITGFTLGMVMTWYMNAYDYALIVGGKPFWSPIFTFPVTYELTILLASFGAFLGMFLTNRLPRHHHSVFNHEGFERSTDDAFFILIETRDPQYQTEATRAFLQDIGGQSITLVEE